MCIQTGKNLSDPDRFRFDDTGYYLKSTDEMYAVDSSDAWQEGCRNTLLVAEQIDTTGMFEAKNLMPKFDIPDGFTEVTWSKEEVRCGMERRFPCYLLVVADFIMWAKNNDIAVGPGRGTAAGSIVAYAMGITDLAPIPHGLIFERFLNPECISKPDVDIYFDERRPQHGNHGERPGSGLTPLRGHRLERVSGTAAEEPPRGTPTAADLRLLRTRAHPTAPPTSATPRFHRRYCEAGKIQGT